MILNLTESEIEVLWWAVGNSRRVLHPDPATNVTCQCSCCTAFRRVDERFRDVVANRHRV